MNTATQATFNGTRNTSVASYDAIVVGAGVSGLYQVHRLREEGFTVRAFETGSDVGGTWYWNRYPGARFDSEAYIYQYFFSEALYKEWSWSERYPGQEEVEQWLHFVADRLNLRKDIQFNTRIDQAHYDEDRKRWVIKTNTGETFESQFFIACTGMLSAPLTDKFEGQRSFKGQLIHTGRWPKDPVEYKGKRVGVIGNGATGIQVIQTIAGKPDLLQVFIRTPQYMIPMRNPKYTDEDIAHYKSRYKELISKLPHTFSGFEYEFVGAWQDMTPEARLEALEEIWADGSLRLWIGSFAELFTDPEVSEEISEFVREKMRKRLNYDQRLCDLLIPTEYGFGTYRVPLETNYLEAYLRDDVELVSVKDNPIARIVPEGIQLEDGTIHKLDIIIMATGFDAATGSLTRIDIRGRDGRSLKADWAEDIRTAMGLKVHGYPNLFMTGAPLAPAAALCNMPTCLQQQVDWITDCMVHMREQNKTEIEATQETQDAWTEHHDEVANATLVPQTNSWYMGGNVEGKPRRLLSYIGGVGNYRKQCDDIREQGYPGFNLA